MFIIPRQPMIIADVLRTGFFFWLESFKQALPFAVLFVVSGLCYDFIEKSLGINDPQIELSAYSTHWWILMISVSLYMILIFVSQTGIIISLYAQSQNQTMDFNQAASIAIRKAWRFSVVAGLYGLMVFIGGVLLVIPGLLILVTFWFAPYIVIFSDKGILDSLKESSRIVSNNWFHTAGVLVIILIPNACLTALQYFWTNNTFGIALVALIGPLIATFTCAMTITLYYELLARHQKENSDLPSIQA